MALRRQWSSELAARDGFILLYSTVDRRSFEQLQSYINLVQTHKKGAPFVFVIAGNKEDLKEQRAVTSTEAMQFAKSVGANYIETSAKTGQNVSEAFELLVRSIHDTQSRKVKKRSEEKQRCTFL
jgi:Ras-related protein Rab-21